MASTPSSFDQTTSVKSVDSSLWWDSFKLLLSELENSPLSSDFPPSLINKLRDNRAWLLDTVSFFKPPNQKSRDALNARQVNVGEHKLIILPELREATLKISSILCLDEIQTYILVNMSIKQNNLPGNQMVPELLNFAMLQYYIERQCLLKCPRQILMHALYIHDDYKDDSSARKEAQDLISKGLEQRLLSLLQNLMSRGYPENMDVDIFTLWAEEMLIEENLILDIIFLLYYESYSVCNGKQWKQFCELYEGAISGSSNLEKLAVSSEAVRSIYHLRLQLLLILMETLDLESLLQMIHDEKPFSEGSITFSLRDIQEMDAHISALSAFETREAGPLILTWAVFLCLVLSLPRKEENSILMEIDHLGYLRQAFEVGSLNYFLEILESEIMNGSDSPVAGYRSVLRTFVSSFIASYEISLQLEDNTLQLILSIICKIYQGEESLCTQFWDKDSFIDGPIRCLLCTLEGEFPFRMAELVRVLSALCEGAWPAECVYNFLNKSVGVSSLFQLSNGSFIDEVSLIVQTNLLLPIPKVEGLLVPCKTRGHIVRMIDGNTALVRWEYVQSGMVLLIWRLAQSLYLDSSGEDLVILELLSRIVSFNMAACYSLMGTGGSLHVKNPGLDGHTEANLWVNVAATICSFIKKTSSSHNGPLMMSMSIGILARMLKCYPSCILEMVLHANIFDVDLRLNPLSIHNDGLSRGSWMLPGKLVNMLLIDCEHNDGCPLTLSVLDFTMQLVETGAENDIILSLVIFSLQYVLVNHEHWKYRVKQARWKVTLKVLDVVKKCVESVPYMQKLAVLVRNVLLTDSSIHNSLFRVSSTTTQALEKLYVNRLYEPMEVEGLELAICTSLDILFCMLSDIFKDLPPSFSVFHQALVSSSTKPMPVSTATISLMSYFHNPNIQIGAAKVLSRLFVLADYSQLTVTENSCFGLDEKQIAYFRDSIFNILSDHSQRNQELVASTFRVLTAIASHQPAFLVAVVGSKEGTELNHANDQTNLNEAGTKSLISEVNIIEVVMQYVMKSTDLFDSNPSMLLTVINLLKVLWQAGSTFSMILDIMRNSENFWKQLSNCITKIATTEHNLSENESHLDAEKVAYRYQCQSGTMQILSYELFLQKKLSHAEVLAKQNIKSRDIKKTDGGKTSSFDLKSFLASFSKGSVGVLINSYSSRENDKDKHHHAKVAASLLCVHVMENVKDGDAGSLSVSLFEKIRVLERKLTDMAAFKELVAQYMQQGYSEGKELHSLILSDLYYHIQGVLEGREIGPGSFKVLLQYLMESKFLQIYKHKYNEDFFAQTKDVYVYNLSRLRVDLGLDMWDYSKWKSSKPVAEKMFSSLQDVNHMVLLASSKLCALKSLITFLSMIGYDSNEKAKDNGVIPKQLIMSCIDNVSQCLQDTIDSLSLLTPNPPEDVVDFLAAQAELLLYLSRNASFSIPNRVHILKSLGSGLKTLSNLTSYITAANETRKLLLLLLLSLIKSSCSNSESDEPLAIESIEVLSDQSNISLSLLPILCNCTEPAEHGILSLTIIDLILGGLLTPKTWFPIIQKNLPLRHFILKVQDKSSIPYVTRILKFLLTLARVREGAEMLLTATFLPCIRELFSDLSDGRIISSCENTNEAWHLWGLCLAVITAMIQSLGDSRFCSDTVEYVLANFVLEKVNLISYYLSAPELHYDHGKTEVRTRKVRTSLHSLRETEYTIALICELSKHGNSWAKAVKEMGSDLRERVIHLLGFVSRGRESPEKGAYFLCRPVLKEELDWYKRPSFVGNRSGWFGLTPIGCCGLETTFSDVSSSCKAIALVTKNDGARFPQTEFSDTVAVEIYHLAFLLLEFLCLEAEGAVRRAEEVGFVDLAHFPELPMPEILHGLQDQGMTIVAELCENSRSKQIPFKIHGLCIMLLQITEMSLNLEFCVLQICGIRPVLGRVDDISKSVKRLLKGAEGHACLKEPVRSLKNILSFLYPGLLQNEAAYS
ncbi:uncharacterized protein LOC124937067 [Impatiens glandulifera]|uniref:uncharacterized protein LOC124937067 n=1 Tax=Impatiens glandulifera TaxID=253017 RepID=UPI001FB11540|nr:uncharacterized protein LOC124937067 [Impatiens glandulifera]